MINEKAEKIKDYIVFSVPPFFQALLVLMALNTIVKIVGVEGRGIIINIFAVTSLISIATKMGSNLLIIPRIRQEGLANVLREFLVLTLFTSVPLAVLTFLYWYYWIASDQKVSASILIAAVLLSNISSSLGSIVAATFARRHYIAWNLGQAIILCFALYFSEKLKKNNIDSILYCYVAAGFYQVAYAIIFYRGIIFSKNKLGLILPGIGMKSYLFGISKELVYRIDLILLPGILTAKEFGQYSIVQSIAQMSWRATDPIILMEMRGVLAGGGQSVRTLKSSNLILFSLLLCGIYFSTLEIFFRLILKIDMGSNAILTSVYMTIIAFVAIWRSFISRAMTSGDYNESLKSIFGYSVVYVSAAMAINDLNDSMTVHGLAVVILIFRSIVHYNVRGN